MNHAKSSNKNYGYLSKTGQFSALTMVDIKAVQVIDFKYYPGLGG